MIPADGCADIILRDGKLLIAGPSTGWLIARGGAQGWTVGLRFRAGLAGAVLGADPLALRDRVVQADEVLERTALRKAEAALRTVATADEQRLAAESGHLDGSERPRPRPRALRDLARTASRALDLDVDPQLVAWTEEIRAAAGRGEPAELLSRRLGYSERQLRRRTGLAFGYGYAALRRVLRAERARSLLLAGVVPADAAQLAGYADQPHLTREFRRVVGATPTQVMASRAYSGESAGNGA